MNNNQLFSVNRDKRKAKKDNKNEQLRNESQLAQEKAELEFARMGWNEPVEQ